MDNDIVGSETIITPEIKDLFDELLNQNTSQDYSMPLVNNNWYDQRLESIKTDWLDSLTLSTDSIKAIQLENKSLDVDLKEDSFSLKRK